MSKKLRECPFCGKSDKLTIYTESMEQHGELLWSRYGVKCNRCHFEIPTCEKKEAAIHKWNTRPAEEALKAERMSKIKCPQCGSENILTERRLDGFHACLECLYRWKIGESEPKQTLFDRITASPEVLAPKFVYYTVSRDQFGTYYWYCSALIPGEKWSEEVEAIAATVAKLNFPAATESKVNNGSR